MTIGKKKTVFGASVDEEGIITIQISEDQFDRLRVLLAKTEGWEAESLSLEVIADSFDLDPN